MVGRGGMIRRWRGIGSNGSSQYVPMTPETISLCSGIGYYVFGIPCWAYSKTAWEEAAALNPANITPSQEWAPAGPTVQQLTGQAPIDPATQAALGVKISQAQVAQNVQNQPALDKPLDCTSFFTYLTNSACPVDCTNWWSNYMNSSCPGYQSLQTYGLVLLAGAGVLLVLYLRR